MTRLLSLAGLLIALVAAGISVLASAQSSHQWLVTSANDSGAGTLREAIERANASDGADTIRFASAMTIRPRDGLPPLEDAGITIDATSGEASVDVQPRVWLDGSAAGDAAGLELNAANAVVRGLGIGGFERYGIGVIGEDASGAQIEGNWIGFDSSDGVAGNQLSGVAVIAGADHIVIRDNRIGGNSSERRTGHGIVVGGRGSYAEITDNVIGIAADGSAAANDDGILIVDSAHARVRGNTVGNSRVAGIELRDTWRVVTVDDNLIGIREGGALAPNDVGVFLGPGSSGAQIGSRVANVVAGNRVGIAVEQGAREAWIQNNWLGLAPRSGSETSAASLPQAIVRPNVERGISVIAGAAVIRVQNNYVAAGQYGIVIDDVQTTQVSMIANVVAGSRQQRSEAAIDIRAGTEISVGGDARGFGNHVCGATFGIRVAQTEAPLLHHNAVGAGAASRVTFDSDADLRWGIRLNDQVVRARVQDNTIADADSAAISVVGNGAQDNSLRGNRYLRNGLDIDLGADGPDQNDPGDRDSGPNGRLNAPLITEHHVRQIGSGVFQSTYRGTATPGSRVELYFDEGQAQRRIGGIVLVDRSGQWESRGAAELPIGPIRALAISGLGSTSEFSDWFLPSQRVRLRSGTNWFAWTGPEVPIGEGLSGIARWINSVWVWDSAAASWRGWSPAAPASILSHSGAITVLRPGDMLRVQLARRGSSPPRDFFLPSGGAFDLDGSWSLVRGYNAVTWIGPTIDAYDAIAAIERVSRQGIGEIRQWDAETQAWRIIWPRLIGAWQPSEWTYPTLWIRAIEASQIPYSALR